MTGNCFYTYIVLYNYKEFIYGVGIMKVYIVTTGCYPDDYMIEKVFSNRSSAEEYKKWHNIKNEIQEYEIYNEPLTKEDGERTMFIKVQGTVFPEAIIDISYDIRPHMYREGYTTKGSGILKYKKPGAYVIYNYYYVPINKWDEEEYKVKLTKSLYVLADMAKTMFANGASITEVGNILRHTVEENYLF